VYDPADFTEHRGTMRASITNYRRNRQGGMILEMVIEDEDKHTALDLADGGDFIVKVEVYGIGD
jgi:hypothetical protein